MTLLIHWKGDTQNASIDITDRGFYPAGLGMLDVDLRGTPGGDALLIRNGLVDPNNRAKQIGTQTGILTLTYGGLTLAHQEVSIPDGTSVALSMPKGPVPQIPESVVAWILRDSTRASWPMSKVNELLAYFQSPSFSPYYKGQPGYDEPEPDQSGSPRMVEYAWSTALGAALMQRCDIPVPPSFRQASFDWCRLQHRRCWGYYGPDGEPWRFSNELDSFLDELGWRKTGPYTVARPSQAIYQAADDEHDTIDREWFSAVGWNDPLAWLALDHQGEMICSRPIARDSGQHGNLRAYARTIKALALLVGAWGDKRPQFAKALTTVVEGLRRTCGESAQGIPFTNLRPVQNVDTDYTDSHVAATPADLEKYAGIPEDQVCEMFRGVIVPWAGSALTALGIVRDIPPAFNVAGDVGTLMTDIGECVMGPGRDVEAIDNDQTAALPAPVHDSYAWQVLHRVKRANIAWGGTMTWVPAGVYALGGHNQTLIEWRGLMAGESQMKFIEDMFPVIGL